MPVPWEIIALKATRALSSPLWPVKDVSLVAWLAAVVENSRRRNLILTSSMSAEGFVLMKLEFDTHIHTGQKDWLV